MKKMLLALLISTSVMQFNVISIEKNDTEIEENKTSQKYEVTAPDWSREQYLKYYFENDIFPSNSPDGTDTKLTSGLIQPYLTSKYGAGHIWSIDENESNTVETTYGGIPSNTFESNSILQDAKEESTIKDYEYIGCGPIALITQIDYLVKYAGYSQFIADYEENEQRKNFYIDLFNTITTYPSNGVPANYLEMMGITFPDGTFTFPFDLVNGASQLFLNYNITTGIGHEEVNPDGTYRKMMEIYGDLAPSILPYEDKIINLVSSIDSGMPVIWWTTNYAGEFSNHYMNIFGYELWRGVDSSGNEITQLFFKLRNNGGSDVIHYMDSEMLMGVNSGFIFFEEQLAKITIKSEDYEYTQRYNNEVSAHTLNVDGINVNVERLRTGYINETGFTGTGKWYLTMSAIKKDAGLAYIKYSVPYPINFIYFDISFWSTVEGIDLFQDVVALEYKDSNENWVRGIDFLNSGRSDNGSISCAKHMPDKFRYDFPYGTTEFRFIVSSEITTSSTNNKGRVVLGDLGIVFSSNDPDKSELYITISTRDNHSWIEIYNNSPNAVLVGNYILQPFEAMTIGLFGQGKHIGVMYNYEYYEELVLSVVASSSSILCSLPGSAWIIASSSSSSFGSSDSESEHGTFLEGLIGLLSWLTDKIFEAIILSSKDGRYSLTEVTDDMSCLNEIGEILEHENNIWWPHYNCSHFAIEIWNIVSDKKIEANFIQTPSDLKNKILQYNGEYIIDRNLQGSCEQVGYYTNYANKEFKYVWED